MLVTYILYFNIIIIFKLFYFIDPIQLYKEPTISNMSRKRYKIDESQLNDAQTITNNNNNNDNYNNVNNKLSDKNIKGYCELYAELLVNKLIAFDDITREYVMNDIDNLIFKYKINSQNSRTITTSQHNKTLLNLHKSKNANSIITPRNPTSNCNIIPSTSSSSFNNNSTQLLNLQDLFDPINIKTSPISSPDISV